MIEISQERISTVKREVKRAALPWVLIAMGASLIAFAVSCLVIAH